MTATAELLTVLQAHGVILAAEGDRLRFHPKDKVTPELLARLRDCKSELLAMLRTVNGANVYTIPGNSCETPVVSPAATQDAHGDAGWDLQPSDVAAVAAPRGRATAPVEWPQSAADFCLLLTAEDLPPAPFKLNAWTEVRDAAKMLRSLRADILAGPRGPRAFYGALQRELLALQRFVLQAAENESARTGQTGKKKGNRPS